MSACERFLRHREREEHQGGKDALHRDPPKYVSTPKPSSSVYAIPYVSARASATPGRVAAVAIRTTRSAIDLKRRPNACTPEAARLPPRARERLSSRSSAWTPAHITAASVHPANDQPATRKMGSATTITTV